MKKKKPKIRWGLTKQAMPKSVRQYIDQNYIDKLSETDKDWLNKFNEEYYGNTFRDDKTVVIKKGKNKGKIRKYKKGLHAKANISRTELFNQTNARNRDIYNKSFRVPIDPFLNKNMAELEDYKNFATEEEEEESTEESNTEDLNNTEDY